MSSCSSLHRGIGLAVSLTTFFTSLAIFKFYQADYAGMQLVFDAEWIPGLGAHFKTGIDGISVFLVLLTTFLMPIVIAPVTAGAPYLARETDAHRSAYWRAASRRPGCFPRSPRTPPRPSRR